MRYITGNTYLVGSVLFVRRARKHALDTEAELRLVLANDISTIDEALEVAKAYGISSVRVIQTSRRLRSRS